MVSLNRIINVEDKLAIASLERDNRKLSESLNKTKRDQEAQQALNVQLQQQVNDLQTTIDMLNEQMRNQALQNEKEQNKMVDQCFRLLRAVARLHEKLFDVQMATDKTSTDCPFF